MRFYMKVWANKITINTSYCIVGNFCKAQILVIFANKGQFAKNCACKHCVCKNFITQKFACVLRLHWYFKQVDSVLMMPKQTNQNFPLRRIMESRGGTWLAMQSFSSMTANESLELLFSRLHRSSFLMSSSRM